MVKKPTTFKFKLFILLAVITVPVFGYFIYSAVGGTTINVSLKTNPDLQLGLVGHWTFDGPDMYNNVADISGQGNTGYLQGQTSTTTAPGVIGQALDFDGVDDFIDVGSDSSLNFTTNDFTFSAWFNLQNDGKWNFIYTSGEGGTNDAWWNIHYKTNAVASINVVADDGTTSSGGYTGFVPNTDTWYHLTTVYRHSDSVDVYIDGKLDHNRDISSVTGSLGNSEVGRIGRRDSGGSQDWQGFLDDVRIYNRALSAEEITRLYNLGR